MFYLFDEDDFPRFRQSSSFALDLQIVFQLAKLAENVIQPILNFRSISSIRVQEQSFQVVVVVFQRFHVRLQRLDPGFWTTANKKINTNLLIP